MGSADAHLAVRRELPENAGHGLAGALWYFVCPLLDAWSQAERIHKGEAQ